MTENETNATNNDVKKPEAKDYIPVVLSAGALIFGLVGLIRIANIHRQIIYGGQALICVFMLVLVIRHLRDREKSYIKVLLYVLALLEALRATVLVTIGVNTYVGYVARFLLILLACNCVLTAERIGREGCEKFAVSIVIMEIALYLVFLFGFPGIMLGRLNRFLPLASVLMAACICMLLRTEKLSINE